MVTLIFVTIFILLFCIWFYLNTHIPEKFPPGPPRYPILGSSRYILVEGENGARKSIMHGILKNVEKYGKIFGFYMGSQPFVVIADYNVLKEVDYLQPDSAYR